MQSVSVKVAIKEKTVVFPFHFAEFDVKSMDFFHQKSPLIVKNSGEKIFLHNIPIR